MEILTPEEKSSFITEYSEIKNDLTSFEFINRNTILEEEQINKYEDLQSKLSELNQKIIEKVLGEDLSPQELKNILNLNQIFVGDYLKNILISSTENQRETAIKLIKSIPKIPKVFFEENSKFVSKMRDDFVVVFNNNESYIQNITRLERLLDNNKKDYYEFMDYTRSIKWKSLGAIVVLMIAVGTLATLYGLDKASTKPTPTPNIKPNRNPSTTPFTIIITPDPVLNKRIGIISLTLLGWYHKNTNGCYMVRGSQEYKLDGCSENYYEKDIKNLFNCSCGTLNNNLELPNCNNTEECLKPYCIGNSKCLNKNSDEICKVSGNISLYKCTNKSIGDNDYVYYYYKSNPVSSIVPACLLGEKNIKENYDKKKEKSKVLFYILMILGIIFIIFIILFRYNFMKKKKLKRN